jgi:hypothetical protein
MLAPAGFDPRHTFLRPAEVFLRYGWKKSKGYDMLQSPGFPRRVGDKYRLDTLLAWEERELSGINVSAAAMAGPAAGVGGPFSAPRPQKPIPAIPARKRPGRKTSSGEVA